MVDVLFTATKVDGEKEDFWSQKGKSLLQAIIFLLFEESEYNAEKDENGNISFEKNAKDEFVITCIYAEDKKFEIKNQQENKETTNTLKVEEALQLAQISATQSILTYDSNILKNSQEIGIDDLELDGVLDYEINNQENTIYNGKIYTGEERTYKINVRTYINSIDIERKINFTLNKTNYLAGTVKNESKIQYKDITVAQEDFEKILGDEGYINLTGDDGEAIASITKATKSDENGNIVITLPENTYEVSVETSKPISTGKIDFKATKSIIETEYTAKQIMKFTAIENQATVDGEKITVKTVLANAETEIITGISNGTVKAGETTTAEIAITLLTEDETRKLYKNPRIIITFPEDLEISNTKYKLIYGNGLEIKEGTLKEENGEKILTIDLEGEQKKYPGEVLDATLIIVSADITASKKQISKEKTVYIECVNNIAEDSTSYTRETESINIVQEQSIVVSNTITSLSDKKTATVIGKQENKKITLEQTDKVVNYQVDIEAISNEKETITNAKILGKFPTKNTSNTMDVTLTSQITTNLEKAKVYYSAKENPTEDLTNTQNGWTQDASLEGKNSYLIVLETFENGEDLKARFSFSAVQKSDEVKKAEMGFSVIYEKASGESVVVEATVLGLELESNNTDILLEIERYSEDNYSVKKGLMYYYKVFITNNTNKTLKDLEVKVIANEAINKITNNIVIEELSPGEKLSYVITEEIKDEDINIDQAMIYVSVDYNNKTYKSEIIKEDIEKLEAESTLEIIPKPSNNKFYPGQSFAYILTLKNTGKYKIQDLIIKDKISKKLNINSVEINGEKKSFNLYSDEEDEDYYSMIINTRMVLDVNESIKVDIMVEVLEIENEKQIINKAKIYSEEDFINATEEAKIYLAKEEKIDIVIPKDNTENTDIEQDGNTISTNTVDNNTTIDDNNKSEDDGENDNNDNNNNNNVHIVTPQFNITGQVWLDTEGSGNKANGDKKISDVNVYLVDLNKKTIVKDVNGVNISAKTDKDGEYTLANIPEGSYVVAFEFDTDKYEPTEYKKQGINERNNSDAMLKNIQINGETKDVAVTDVLTVNKNLENIDLGLSELKKFDLELTKTINKVTVTNSKETKNYEFNDTTLAKIEIASKEINNSSIQIEYTIKVKNNGDIAGYVKNIVDYLPSELNFNAELNKNWYIKDNYLYNNSLANEELKAGETKEIKLILTKQMTENNTGLISNIAEIQECSNNSRTADIDSTPSNKQKGEDDMGQADIIIGVKTGKVAVYTILVIAIVILSGVLINLINREFLNK